MGREGNALAFIMPHENDTSSGYIGIAHPHASPHTHHRTTAHTPPHTCGLSLTIVRVSSASDFMKYKGVPFREMEKATGVMDVIPIVRQAATKDRELMEKVLCSVVALCCYVCLCVARSRHLPYPRLQSKLAFVSFVRGYKEHHYKYIFVFERLNLGKLAMAFSLLRVRHFAFAFLFSSLFALFFFFA